MPGGRVRMQGNGGNEFRIAELEVEGFHRFEKQGRTFSMGAALAVAQLDPDTGAVRVERCLVAWDVGLAINPLVVEGQLVGAAAQGIGGAVLEELGYDEAGQPIVTSFLDYAMATALDLPRVEAVVLELGRFAPAGRGLPVKGAGEAGIIGVGAAVANAVADAMPSHDGELRRLPLKPDVVCQLLKSD
jgi:carbon-monoxide dehydrogenase large subunit